MQTAYNLTKPIQLYLIFYYKNSLHLSTYMTNTSAVSV